MTTLIMQAAPLVDAVRPAFERLFLQALRALDGFVANRARNAVPEDEQLRALREIGRYRRMMNGSRTPASAGR